MQMVLGAQLVQSAAHLPLVLKAVMQASTPGEVSAGSHH